MSQQAIVTIPSTGTDFRWDNDLGMYVCAHIGVYLEPPCCSGHDSEGLQDCGCNGQSSIICPAADCTGIEDWELEELSERLQ